MSNINQLDARSKPSSKAAKSPAAIKEIRPRPLIRRRIQSKQRVRKTKSPFYVGLPRRLLEHPPIAHRHTDSDSRRVTTFEFGVLAGILILARRRWSRSMHVRALKAGAAAIKAELQSAEQFRQDWRDTKQARRRLSKQAAPAPIRKHLFPRRAINTYGDVEEHRSELPLNKAVRKAGRYAYRQRLRRLRKGPPPAVVTVTLSRYHLLRFANLADNANNYAKLDATLDRLCQPIGDDDAPLLVRWSPTESGQVLLEVAGTWLQPPYVKVPVPLPLTSPTALGIYLFVYSLQLGGHRHAAFDFDKLCHRLDLPHGGPAVASRAINNGMDIVNVHLQSLNAKALQGCDVRVLDAIDIQKVDGGVHFKMQRYEPGDDGDEELVEVSSLHDKLMSEALGFDVRKLLDAMDSDNEAEVRRLHRIMEGID